MGIVYVHELADGRDGQVGTNDEHRYTRRFQVGTDDPLTGPDAVLVAEVTVGVGEPEQRIPQRGEVYKIGNPGSEVEDAKARVIDIKADQDGDEPTFWTVTVQYGWDPLYEPWKVNWSFQPYERAISKDLADPPKDILNSCGDPFDPPIVIDDSRQVLTIVRNQADFDPAVAKAYKDAVNNDEFFLDITKGFLVDPFKAKMASISGERISYNGGFYWQVTYEMHFRDDGWWPFQVLDQGYFERFGPEPSGPPPWEPGQPDSRPRTQMVDREGQRGVMRLLDGRGKRLAENANPVYLGFQTYKQAPFEALALDYSTP